MNASQPSKLTLLGPGSRPRTARYRCVCGAEKEIQKRHVNSGATRSCGCLVAENNRAKRQRLTHGDCVGGRLSTEYRTWVAMITRCTNPKSPAYHRYGGRGIVICDRWLSSFAAFLEDIGRKPAPGYSLDRIDNNGNYEPDNVRWATAREQSRNTSANHNLTHDGRTMCLTDWAREVGVGKRTLQRRLFEGWTVGRTLTTPLGRKSPKRRAEKQT